jgi:hypothetical protein
MENNVNNNVSIDFSELLNKILGGDNKDIFKFLGDNVEKIEALKNMSKEEIEKRAKDAVDSIIIDTKSNKNSDNSVPKETVNPNVSKSPTHISPVYHKNFDAKKELDRCIEAVKKWFLSDVNKSSNGAVMEFPAYFTINHALTLYILSKAIGANNVECYTFGTVGANDNTFAERIGAGRTIMNTFLKDVSNIINNDCVGIGYNSYIQRSVFNYLYSIAETMNSRVIDTIDKTDLFRNNYSKWEHICDYNILRYFTDSEVLAMYEVANISKSIEMSTDDIKTDAYIAYIDDGGEVPDIIKDFDATDINNTYSENIRKGLCTSEIDCYIPSYIE